MGSRYLVPMLAHRVLAISPVRETRKVISVGLMSAGASVEQHETISELKPGPISDSILVLHLEDAVGTALVGTVCERLADTSRLIVVVPASDIETTVSVMQSSKKVASVLVAEGLTSTTVARAASKLLYGDIFGLEKIVPWGTRVYSTVVGSYHDKSNCIREMSDFASAMSVRRKYREAIEQCADEMLMNALYDAPVDADGKPLFADVPIKERIAMQVEQKPVVQYACSDQTFMFSVRDNYGTLARSTVLKYLDKCLHAEQQIDGKTGGAGLGLYLMASQSSQMTFNVLPGVATECICTFDLKAPKVQLVDMGMFFEQIDSGGRLNPSRPRLLPGGVGFPVERRSREPQASNKAVLWGLSAAIALLVGLIALVAYPRFAVTTGAVRISTSPPGANITIDGKARGSTIEGPLLIGELELDDSHEVRASMSGWTEATRIIKPVRNQTTEIVLNLTASASTVSASSDPSGSELFVDGTSVGITPVRLTTLKPGSEVELEFRKTGYVTKSRTLKVPAPGSEADLAVALSLSPKFATLDLETDPAGADVYLNGQLLAGLQTPVRGHLVPSGTRHEVTFQKPGFQPASLSVKLARGQQGRIANATLVPGGGLSVRSNIPGDLSVRGQAKCQRVPLPANNCPLASGTYTAILDSREMNLRHTFEVEVSDKLVQQELLFGLVESSPGFRIVLSSGRKVRKVALKPGTHNLTIISSETEAIEEMQLTIQAEQKVLVP